ncbi:hypothetical protein SteCoe_25772 [Stentor coeruleus]|uniref:EF-hand domain-containing protein n=1 Tax=Stentor coeruleus TaxID=5963 RepID=A0A1R2BEF3_9CILI|nr:hypothetical protein SteCoe_25772 [Stentor coeruleus]
MLNSDNSEFNFDTRGTEKKTHKKKSIEKLKTQRKSLETEGSESRINRKHILANNKNPSPCNQKKSIKEKSKFQVCENRKTPGFYSRRDSSDQGPSFFFQPKVNSSSKCILRTERIDTTLYKDPIKRSKVNNTPSTYDTKRCPSPKSEQVLIKKFESEFNRISKDLDFDSSGMLNYSKFCQILGKMNFIHQNMIKPNNERELVLKAWEFLGGKDLNKVHKKNLNVFLLAVMNLVKKIRASSNDAILAGTKKNLMLISAESVKKIHKDFYDLFQNRRNLMKITPIREKSSGSSKFITRRASENICEDFVSENYRKNYAVKVSMPDTAEVIVGNEEKRQEPKDLTEGITEVFRTMPSTNLLDTEIDELAVNRSLYSFSRPKLSIPKIAKHKSISLRSNSCSSETTLLKVQFTYHSCSPIPVTKKSKSSSESEGVDLSLINPLVTPPSQLYKDTQVMNFVNSSVSSPSKLRKKSYLNEKNPSVNEFTIKNTCKTSKRYKCQSPESYEDTDKSLLITIVLPDNTEQYLRLHKNDDLNTVLKSFGNKYNLKAEQLTKLKTEILGKIKTSNI